jgi:hypothetical protein
MTYQNAKEKIIDYEYLLDKKFNLSKINIYGDVFCILICPKGENLSILEHWIKNGRDNELTLELLGHKKDGEFEIIIFGYDTQSFFPIEVEEYLRHQKS